LNNRRTLILGSTIILSLMVLASVMPAQSVATPGAWRLISPTEYTTTPNAELHGTYMINGATSGKGSGSGWAVGDNGFIYYWDGFSWNQASVATDCQLDSVNFGGPLNPLSTITSSSGWISGGAIGTGAGATCVAAKNAIALYFNGVSWTSIPVQLTAFPGTPAEMLSVFQVKSFVNTGDTVDAWGVGEENGGLNGAFWHLSSSGPPNPGVNAWSESSMGVAPAPVNSVYMTQVTGIPCAPNCGYAVGDGGNIYAFNGGWTLLASHPVAAHLHGVAMSSSTKGWAVGDSCTIIRTVDGVNWVGGFGPIGCVTPSLRSIVMISSSEAWVVGDSSAPGAQPTILHGTSLDSSSPAWNTIDQSHISASNSLESVTFAPSGGNVWAVGKSGLATFCLSSCGTPLDAIWSTTTSPNSLQLDSVFMVSDSDGWAVGVPDAAFHPTVLRWDGGSSSWTRGKASASVNPTFLLGVYLSSGSSGWAVGGTTGPAASTLYYDGNQWLGRNAPGCTCVLNSVYMVSDSNAWAVGTNGVIMQSATTAGAPFGIQASAVPTANYRSVYFDPTSGGARGWAVGNDGAGNPLIVQYTSGTWAGNLLNAGLITSLGISGVTLNSVFVQDQNHAWAAGDGSTILYYDGLSWTKVSILGIANGPLTITGIAVTGGPPATDGWAVGFDSSNLPITIHYDATSSTWTEVPLSPAITLGGATGALTALSMRSSTNGLAVGTGVTAPFTDSLSLILHLDPPAGSGPSGGTVTVTNTPSITTTTAPATTSSTASSSAAATTSATSSSSSLTSIVTSIATSVKTSIATTTASQTVTAPSSSSVITPVALPGIPGFPWESILLGIIVGLTALGIARRHRRTTKST
jgi:hypothetical protein